MKQMKFRAIGVALIAVMVAIGCGEVDPELPKTNNAPEIRTMQINFTDVVKNQSVTGSFQGTPNTNPSKVQPGNTLMLPTMETDDVDGLPIKTVRLTVASLQNNTATTKSWAVTTGAAPDSGAYTAITPTGTVTLRDGSYLWIKLTLNGVSNYYAIKIGLKYSEIINFAIETQPEGKIYSLSTWSTTPDSDKTLRVAMEEMPESTSYSYQWYSVNGVNADGTPISVPDSIEDVTPAGGALIPGKTNKDFVLNIPTSETTEGYYYFYVIVTYKNSLLPDNADFQDKTKTSNVVVIRLANLGTNDFNITTHPASNTYIVKGSTPSITALSVVLDDAGPFAYQWYQAAGAAPAAGDELVGSSETFTPPPSILNITTPGTKQDYRYYVVVESAVRERTSNIATITVADLSVSNFTISTNPATATYRMVGDNQPTEVTPLSVALGNTSDASDLFAYQWYKAAGTTAVPANDQPVGTSATYTPPATILQDLGTNDTKTYLYYVVVKSAYPKEVISSIATITVTNKAYTDGFGMPDPEWVAKYPYMVIPGLGSEEILTEAKLPQPSYWMNQTTEAGLTGHIHAYPDPFHFANGNRVMTIKDWENRRKELQLLIGYYAKGRVPPIDSGTVDIWLTGTNNTTINIRHKASNRTASFSISVSSNSVLTVAGNEGKLYASSGNSSYGAASTARKTLDTGSHSGLARDAINTLYGITPANMVTRDSAHAWNVSVALTAIQGTDDPTTNGGARQATKQYFYPANTSSPPTSSWFTDKGPFVSSGYSTNGKEAYAHGMGIGRNGGNFGFADVGDSGACGAAIERFVVFAGLRKDVTLGEALGYSGYSNADVIALGLDPALRNPISGYGWPIPIAPLKHRGAADGSAGTLGTFADLKGVPYYTYGLQSGRTWNAGPANTNIANTGTAEFRCVRGWAPYWEAFDATPARGSAFGTVPSSGNWANVKKPFIAYQQPAENWSGIQNWIQAAAEQGSSGSDWLNSVFRQFSDLHGGLNLDNALGQTGRGVQGFSCATPCDSYFIAMINAPYGTSWIRSGANAQIRTNQPAMEAAWLLADEVYKFYGEQEYAMEHNGGVLVEDPNYPGTGLKMGWDKYIWRNGHYEYAWGTHGDNTSDETSAGARLAGYIRSGTATTTTATTGTTGNTGERTTLAKARESMFPLVDDPVVYLAEWHKMDWGRPGAPTIAERVRRRVEPNLKDYFMGEQYHQAPASGISPATYHDAAKSAYTPTGTKWKRMDWRGLIDNPEPEL